MPLESVVSVDGRDGHIESRFYELMYEHGLFYKNTAAWATKDRAVPEDWPDYTVAASAKTKDGGTYVLFNHKNVLIILTVMVTTMQVVVATNVWKYGNEIVDAFKAKYPRLAPETPNQIPVRFWYMSSQGPKSRTRMISVPEWSDIAPNYTAEAAEGVNSLLGEWRPSTGGKLMLWQGAPGTGKTYAIRALAKNWHSWATMSYIADTEKFFGDAAYLMSVLMESDDGTFPDDDPTDSTKTHLVVLEDAGELLTKDARQHTGQGLSRLLNITDGMMGQGLNVLLLITTNEDLGALHEAVSRPGRCVSQISFKGLNPAEAAAWREAHGAEKLMTGSSISIAELYAELAGRKIKKHRAVGFAA